MFGKKEAECKRCKELEKAIARIKLSERRSDAVMSLELIIITIEGMRKQLKNFDSLALSHEEYSKLHGADKARIWADIDYDVLGYVLKLLEV